MMISTIEKQNLKRNKEVVNVDGLSDFKSDGEFEKQIEEQDKDEEEGEEELLEKTEEEIMRDELIKLQTMVNKDKHNKIKVSNDGFVLIQNSELPYLNNRFNSIKLKSLPKDVKD